MDASYASPAQPAPVEQAARVPVSYNGLTGAPVYESGLPYCSLDGLCPPEIIAEMRVNIYYTAMFAAEIAAGTLAPTIW